jgi:hypothetical protein
VASSGGGAGSTGGSRSGLQPEGVAEAGATPPASREATRVNGNPLCNWNVRAREQEGSGGGK